MDREAWRAVIHGVAKSWIISSEFCYEFQLSLDSGSCLSMGMRVYVCCVCVCYVGEQVRVGAAE